jgi:prefoldin subunit 5
MGTYNFSYQSLEERLTALERDFDQALRVLLDRIEYLEEENVGTTNALYELENRLDMLTKCQYNMLE